MTKPICTTPLRTVGFSASVQHLYAKASGIYICREIVGKTLFANTVEIVFNYHSRD